MHLVNDERGVAWTVGQEPAAARLFEAIGHYLTFRADTMDRLDALLADDPDCPGAWVLKGYLFLLARSAPLIAKARDAQARASCIAASPREELHVRALKAWCDGDVLGAQRLWDAIAVDHPHDLLALRVQHFSAMFLGRPDHLRSTTTRALADWSDDVPGAGFVYGMACMGLEETGDFTRAERLGRRGAELEPDDLWSVHSVAHVMEAQGRLAEGCDWMVRPEAFLAGRGPMRHHLLWHEALFLYESGAYDRVLDYYDSRLVPTETPTYMEVSNGASLLLRLEAAGVSCGGRREALAAQCAHMIEGRALTFADIHTLFAFAMAGDGTSLAKLAREIETYADTGDTFDRRAAAAIAVPVARALTARHEGSADRAADILLDARFDFPRMGGSNAQRDVLDILLIDCTIAAGRTPAARRLLTEYLDLRPDSVPMRQRLESLAPN